MYDDEMMDAFVEETRDYADEAEMQDLAEFLRGTMTATRNLFPITMRIGITSSADLIPTWGATRTIANRPSISAGQFHFSRPPI